MNIQRKYSLPNCTLLLEGLSDVTLSGHFQELRPELSILVNAECYLSSYTQPIAGGREFFESLVRAVSAYAQEFLSSVPNPQAHNHESELVELQKIDSNRHKLIVHSEIATEGFESKSNDLKQPFIQVDLNTVQLFDLVEAVDQFFADTQTLPELSLELQPVTRRYGGASQAVLKQAVPATVGLSTLAVAAIAFSLIPPPQVRLPEPKPEEQSSTTTPTVSPTAIASETPTTTPTVSPTAIASETPTTTPTASPTAIIKDLEALLNSVPEITDPSQLRALNRQVYNQIHPVWNNRSEVRENLIYRLGVAADGSIVGYKAVNKGSNEAVDKTPLPNLLYNPANRNIANERIAQFRVVFTKQGVLEVSPWLGYARKPEVIGEKINDTNTVKDLNQKLYNTIRQNWSITPTFNKDLKYRVAVNTIGVIADYEPLNQVAFDFFRETPLPQMFQTVYGSNAAAPNNKEPLAHFQVVFKSNGTLEVSPWQGYR
ncbi:DUF4335 domain-containing protein [Anabaena cylindrica FACHB-243]|uniref:DUF4335 domain-containing protein n=1 Tax=Anabaena cylindrica (strain ATCC 27899 / PCC 7122) TaxID=272123 RepID=K9ZQI9_ANACC|nr:MULTISPECIES: DUF4335 domain-containing protein [Anabaena]AFZ60802.1 hypothetical protein Anacy_5490 [Anabaena cylindrica PCC 7122]MBD2417102.1 DUF4335 domain-containing protein [Anabaena cylindrica FACHB-243]MBY5280798.1 DUF4335 domain-containing protein [Anabaena sp. CCAP 1446/1C]MBY5307074.1 DUF4335 domain-containing protein [Anabaena sp. CCAP 1446/1C]MCM2406803.1 DUF4335 domain-containing protein [Anabaena sp. CCAP 1446/1C]